MNTNNSDLIVFKLTETMDRYVQDCERLLLHLPHWMKLVHDQDTTTLCGNEFKRVKLIPYNYRACLNIVHLCFCLRLTRTVWGQTIWQGSSKAPLLNLNMKAGPLWHHNRLSGRLRSESTGIPDDSKIVPRLKITGINVCSEMPL